MVQSPFDEVTTVFPSAVEDDMLAEPELAPDCVVIDVPPPVVKPDTLPSPAVTELFMLPEGGVSPGLRWTVLQLALFGPELEDVVVLLPFEDDELDELLLSAWAAVTMAITTAAQNMACFIVMLRESD